MVGSTLSHYEVLDELGRGGMGIVYRARDVRLDRIVALKVLPSNALAHDDDRARFFREARAAAKLQHPHIASIYETDEAVPEGARDEEARPFIALEFIDGQDLADRIAEGPLKLADVIRIGLEMAEALEAAHEKDIVHRDIKPQNVMLTAKGDVKVLDFGLAKTAASTMLTRAGSTLGTVAYMSPEQAAGEEVDRRTDLWSLGVTLYEMITGRHPFARDYEQAVVYSILNEDPEPVTALRSGVPMGLEWIVEKALAKDAGLRYQTAADLVADLKAVELSGSGSRRHTKVAPTTSSDTAVTPSPSSRSGMPPWGWLAVLAGIAAGALGAWAMTGSEPADDGPVMRLTLDVWKGEEARGPITVSPSGSYLAYKKDDGVWIRDLGSDEEWFIPSSTEVSRIVFTGDEEWLFLERPGMILRAPVRGGEAYEVVPVDAVWSTVNVASDTEIIYESGGSVWRLDLARGEPEALLTQDSLLYYDDPFLTGDGRTLLVSHHYTGPEGMTVGVYDYPAGTLRGELDVPAYFPSYMDSGHLLFKTDRMHVVPVDLERVELLGPVIPLPEGVVGRGAMTVTDTGHLFFLGLQGSSTVAHERGFEVESWGGRTSMASPEAMAYRSFSLDPSGRRMAVVTTAGGDDVWVVALDSGARLQLTRSGVARDPSWHPGGDSVLFVDVGGRQESSISMAPADGLEEPRVLYRTEGWTAARPRMNADGRFVLFEQVDPSGGPTRAIWRLDTAAGQAEPVVDNGVISDDASYSPDGRLVVYAERDREGGRPHVWVARSSFGGERWDASRQPGWNARWAPDGRSIFYASQLGIKRVDIRDTADEVRVSDPVMVLPGDNSFYVPWELLPDGSGVMRMIRSAGESGPDVWLTPDGLIHVVMNWWSELEEVAPVRR